MEAVNEFAGEDPERAKFCPGDGGLLADTVRHADHFEIASADIDVAAMIRAGA